MDSDIENTPSESEITEKATNETTHMRNNIPTFHIPEASRKKYELAYTRFTEWLNTNNIKSLSENVLLSYFDILSKDYKVTTLWSIYSMLRNTLLVKNNINIAHYCKLRAFLQRQSKGYLAKKSKTLTSNEIHKFIKEASDDQYLLIKVALAIGITGACRRDELWKLTVDDLVDLNSALLVNIPDAKTKVPRSFTVTGNLYEIYKKYASLRPSGEKRFFLNYQYGKCTRQVVGINKLGRMAYQIASYLKLPNAKLYTGHCFRRSSALQRPRPDGWGWKSSTVIESYNDESISSKIKIERPIVEEDESHNQETISTPIFTLIEYDTDPDQDSDGQQITDTEQDTGAEQDAKVIHEKEPAEIINKSKIPTKTRETKIPFSNSIKLEKQTATKIKSENAAFSDFISSRMSLMKNKKKCKKFQHDVMKLLIEYEEDSESN